VTGYYLGPQFFLWRRMTLAACALVLFAAVPAQTQSAPTASPRGEAYEKCKSFFSGTATELPDSDENNAFLGSCGWKFADYYELSEAGKAFEREKQMAEHRGDRIKLADALDGQAAIFREKGDFMSADKLLQQAVGIGEEAQDKYELSRLYNSLARLRGEENRPEEAYDYYLRSLKVSQEINNPLRIAVASNNIATYLQSIGDNFHALEYLQQSLSALQQINEELKSATVLTNIGLSYKDLGEFAKAIESIQQGLAIREKFKEPTQLGKSFDTLGIAYLDQGNYAAALEALQKGLEFRTKTALPRHVADSLNNIAMVYEAQGEYAEAISYLHKSVELEKKKLGDAGLEAEIDSNLGEAYFLQGDYPHAAVALQQAVKNAEAAKDKLATVRSQYTLGRLYLREGRLREADEMLSAAAKYFESSHLPPDLGNTLVELSQVKRRRGSLQESLQIATRAKELGEQIGLPEVQWRSLTVLGEVNASLGHRDEAAKSFEAAIAVIEDLRTKVAGAEENRAHFFAERVAPYQERIALALAAEKTDDALYYAERSKARVLVDVIGADRASVTTAMSDDERERETKLRSALASLNSQILAAAQANPPAEKRLATLKPQRDEARLRYEDFESTLYSAHPELAVSRGKVSIVHASDARTLLPSRSAAIVEYAVVRNRTWVFVITTRGVRALELPLTNSQIRQHVERFREQVARRDLNVPDSARLLYQEVVAPADAYLKNKTELVVIPDGVLWDLPYQALQSRPGHYLIEDIAISYAPSLTALREMMRPRSRVGQQATLIAFGNPTIGAGVGPRRKAALMDESLSPLPAAEIQAKSVAQIYSPDSRVYVGAEAREDLWKSESPSYRIVHLATHGVLDNRSPLYSYLVLAPSDDPKDPQNGLLEAWEIMRMSLNADLVVLSACETARGKVSAGEATIGITWAFFVAGSPATLVTQWKVESASSTALMTAFHRGWKGGGTGLSKAKALQMAAVQMLHKRNYSDPFYWAGYILIGDGR
jgi:CHAT domain-containing protein